MITTTQRVSAIPLLEDEELLKPVTSVVRRALQWQYEWTNSDGDLIYVGQAFHNDNLLPAKVIPNARCALISYDGEEFLKRSCQVLCCNNASWETVKDGIIPANAIPGGYTISGEALYIGRTHFCGSLTPGRVVPSERKLYIPYGRCEVVSKRFEILVV